MTRIRGVWCVKVLSLQKCRELLGYNSTLSDSSLELLRDQLYAFADIATTELIEQGRNGCAENSFGNGLQLVANPEALAVPSEAEDFEEFLRLLPAEEHEESEERAAVLEYDGGLMRNQAERVVMIEHWRKRKQGDASNASSYSETN